MARLLNTFFGRAYTYEDLIKESAPFLSNPKFPPGLPEVMGHFDGRKRTFVEYIQFSFKDYLKQIAKKRTKADQRAELLSSILQERSWCAAERAVKDAKHPESWEHLTKDTPLFEMYPKTEWRRLLLGRHMSAVVMGSWLFGIGRSLYQIENYYQDLLELHENYDAEIKTLQVGMLELMLEKLSNYEDDQGRQIGKFTDEVIKPLIDEQHTILDRLAADIKANKIDLSFYRTQFGRIEEIKRFVARTVASTAIPN